MSINASRVYIARSSPTGNKRWIPQIEKLLQDKRDYFVVVGALHLVATAALQLMRQDGFKPEPLN